MELSEIIQQLNNMKVNGALDIVKFTNEIGIEVVSDKHITAIKIVNELNKLMNSDNCVDAIKKMKEENITVKKDVFSVMRTNKMLEAFGPAKIKDENNLKRNAAEMLVGTDIITEKELDKQIEDAKNNSIVKSFSYAEADYRSDKNDLTGKEINSKKIENSSECVTI